MLVAILDEWAELRKEARVAAGHRRVRVDGRDRRAGQRDQARPRQGGAAITALDQFKDDDEVGLWVFSTDLGGEHPNWREVVPIGPIGRQREDLAAQIERQIPVQRDAALRGHRGAYEAMLGEYDPRGSTRSCCSPTA